MKSSNNILKVAKQSFKLRPLKQISSTNDQRFDTGERVDSSRPAAKNMLFSGSLTILCTASGSVLMQQSASNLVKGCVGRKRSGDSDDIIDGIFPSSFYTLNNFSENSFQPSLG